MSEILLTRIVGPLIGLVCALSVGTAAAQASHDATEPASQRLITLQLGGGASFPSIGPLNAAFGASSDPLIEKNYSVNGAMSAVGSGTDLGADVIVHVNARLGIVFGGGVTRGLEGGGDVKALRTPNTVDADSLTPVAETSDLRQQVRLRIVPLRLGLQLSIPIARALNARAQAGVGYHMVHWEASETYAWNADYRMPFYAFSYSVNSTSDSKLTGHALGFQGGVGLEYRLTRRIGVYVEGAYQHARVTSLKGDLTKKETDQLTDHTGPTTNTSSYTGAGTAYTYEMQILPGGHWSPVTEVAKEPPPEREYGDAGRGQRGVKELMLDLSGASVKFGVSVSF